MSGHNVVGQTWLPDTSSRGTSRAQYQRRPRAKRLQDPHRNAQRSAIRTFARSRSKGSQTRIDTRHAHTPATRGFRRKSVERESDPHRHAQRSAVRSGGAKLSKTDTDDHRHAARRREHEQITTTHGVECVAAACNVETCFVYTEVGPVNWESVLALYQSAVNEDEWIRREGRGGLVPFGFLTEVHQQSRPTCGRSGEMRGGAPNCRDQENA